MASPIRTGGTLAETLGLLLALRKKHGLTSDRVAAVEVDVGPVDATCGRPAPKHVEDARFSFQHILASASPTATEQPDVTALMRVLTCGRES